MSLRFERQVVTNLLSREKPDAALRGALFSFRFGSYLSGGDNNNTPIMTHSGILSRGAEAELDAARSVHGLTPVPA